jgi:hypothetical protein
MVKIGKHIITFIFLFIWSISIAQKPDIQLTINKKPVEVGQAVVFTVKTNIDAPIQFDFPNSFIQGGNSKSVQQSFINNSWSIVVENAQEGVFKKEGKFTIVALVKDKGKTFKSNPLVVSVKPKSDPAKKRKYDNTEGEITKFNMKEPVFGIIEKSSAKIYEGEPLILAAKVYSRVNLNMMQNYKSFSLKGAAETFDLEKSDNFSLNRENYQGTTFLTFSCGKQLIFPASVGKFVVKPFEMILQYSTGGFFDSQLRLESNATVVDVLPLPKGAPKDFIGAVGKYTLQTSLSKNTAKVGDVISLEMIVKGTGNLHTISKPKLNLPDGLSLYGDPEIKEDLDYTDDGVSGFKSYLFHLKVNNGGKIELPNLSISYFDPSLKKYITIKGKSESIVVDGPVEVAKVQVADSSISQQGEEVLVKPTKLEETQKSIPNANKWIVFLLFIIGILAGLLLITFLKKSKKKSVQAEESKHVEPMVAYEKKTVPSTSFIEDAETFALRGDYHAAYSLIHKHLPKYVITQLNFQDPDFSSKSLVDVMKQHTISQNIIDDYQYIIKTCEEVIYGYAEKSIEFQEFIGKIKSLIKIF